MTELFSLGDIYVSDFLKEGETPRGGKVEMKLILDELNTPRLEKSANLDTMYGRYWYRSGINTTMRNELKSIVESITSIYKLDTGDVWLDIACNDGTLLEYVPNNLFKIGIDPADDSFKAESETKANAIVQDYFSVGAYFGVLKDKAKVITSIAMFYDVEDRNTFLSDIYDVLDHNGLWVLQLSYTPLMLHQLAFDNLCHEHIYYYSLLDIKRLLEAYGFRIMDCQLNDVNGGSFRLYVMKESANHSLFGTQPYRDVCDVRLCSLIKYEMSLNVNKETWLDFYDRILNLRDTTVTFIERAKADGKTVYGYGASTKGNTLLQFFGLDHTMIDAIAERSHYKWGLKTVGTNIPIVSEEEMREKHPDYLLVLPWHFINEFKQRESIYLSKGGKFIVPCPQFKIIN
jgi:hypothetical protein